MIWISTDIAPAGGNDQRLIQIIIILLQSKLKMPSLVFPAKPFLVLYSFIEDNKSNYFRSV